MPTWGLEPVDALELLGVGHGPGVDGIGLQLAHEGRELGHWCVAPDVVGHLGHGCT